MGPDKAWHHAWPCWRFASSKLILLSSFISQFCVPPTMQALRTMRLLLILGNKNNSLRVVSNDLTFITSFVKTDWLIQKLKVRHSVGMLQAHFLSLRRKIGKKLISSSSKPWFSFPSPRTFLSADQEIPWYYGSQIFFTVVSEAATGPCFGQRSRTSGKRQRVSCPPLKCGLRPKGGCVLCTSPTPTAQRFVRRKKGIWVKEIHTRWLWYLFLI